MAPPKQQDMPFGVAVIFAVVGTAILAVLLFAWIGPAAWVRFAYRPAAATVADKRVATESVKGGSLHRLEVLLQYRVAGRDYSGWVRLPNSTRKATGPEADAIFNQMALGEEVTCYHDPINPAAGVVLDNHRLAWSMLAAPIFPALMVLVGTAGMIASYRKTFPRGARAAAADLLHRLPGRFYLAAGGALFVVGALVLLLRNSAVLGGWTCLLLPAGIGVTVWLVRTAVSFGAVALPSPEARAAAAREANTAPASAPPAAWNRAEPIATAPGAELPFRLKADGGCGTAGGVAILALYAALVLAVLLVKLTLSLTSGMEARPRGPVVAVLILLFFLPAGAALFVAGRRFVRRFTGLTVELSDHPLRAGSPCRLALRHAEPDFAGRVRLELVCEEEATASGKNKSSTRNVVVRQPVALKEVPGRDGLRAGEFQVSAGAPASFKLEYHLVAWRLEARVGRGWLWKIGYPVTVEAVAVQDGPVPKPGGPLRLDDDVVSLWLDRPASVFAPRDVLSGGYAVRPSDDGSLRTAELSVVWTTEPPGVTELGVCHYEGQEAVADNDLRPYQPRAFRARLPDGPPSHDGQAVKVRWAVRLRLRYVNGEERVRELPFRLGAPG